MQSVGQQLKLRKLYDAAFVETNLAHHVGISKTFDLKIRPLSGLRHPPQAGRPAGTSGQVSYRRSRIFCSALRSPYCGEMSGRDAFLGLGARLAVPMHAEP